MTHPVEDAAALHRHAHEVSDVDIGPTSKHHTLGPGGAAAFKHTHTESDVTNLSTDLASALAGISPIGAVLPYAGSGTPTNWLFCDGSSLLRATYPALFAVIGTTYGAVDGTHFTLPDLRLKFPRGSNTTPGATGGADTVTLAIADLPSHDHSTPTGSGGAHDHGGQVDQTGAAHTHNNDVRWATTTTVTGAATRVTDVDNVSGATGGTLSTGNTGSTGSGHNHNIANHTGHTHAITAQGGGSSHENKPPYLDLRFIIRAT